MRNLRLLPIACLLLLSLVSLSSAHREEIASLVRVEKVFDAPRPLGRIRSVYSAAEGKDGGPSLLLQCDAFQKVELSADALTDLPRPDWGALVVPFSLTSYDMQARNFVDRPYLYIQVPVRGTPGETWPDTWVLFKFDAEGKFTGRRIKQFLPQPDGKSIRELNEDWPIGKDVKAADLLNAARNR